MSLCTDTKDTITDSIDDSICEVFEMMAGQCLRRLDDVQLETDADPMDELTVVMGMSGDLQGSLSVTMTESAALQWTASLIEIDTGEIDQTVVDAVGELGNMVVGGAKRRLSGFNLTMSLPSVIRAGADQIRFSSNTIPLKLHYQFGGHMITVIIALSHNAD